jgi:hypothetical protein
MPSSMRDPWFVTGVLANIALGVVLAGLVLSPMYIALKWWISHHHRLRQPGAKRPLRGSTGLKQRLRARAHLSEGNRRVPVRALGWASTSDETLSHKTR